MSTQISCRTIFQTEHLVEKEKMTFRPSAYGLIIHEGKILLSTMRSTGKWTAPGGGVEIGETLHETVKREVMEECGIKVRIGDFAFFEETFFYYEPYDAAWHCHLFYFFCTPETFEVSDALNPAEDESIQPQWVSISSLRAKDFQMSGEKIINALRLCS